MNKKRIIVTIFALVLVALLAYIGINSKKNIPIPTGLIVNSVSSESSIMSWKTDKPTLTELYYSTTPISKAEKKMVVKDYTPSNTHTIEITHLQSKTKYYFRIVSMVEKDGPSSITEGEFTSS